MDLLECPVCLETFQDPVLLPSCGHTFCSRCVDRLHRCACPTCRAAFRRGEPRPNFALRQLLADRGHALPAASPPAMSPALPTLGGLRRSLTRGCAAQGNVAVADVDQIRRLESLGVPYGLAKLLVEEDKQIGLRIFLLDNSGSTASYDGHYFEEMPDGKLISRPCTRWEEIKHMALEQARWNATVGTPCEFVLLNPGPGVPQEGRDFVRMGRGEHSAIGALQSMLERNGPQGMTPLVDRLSEIYERIRGEHAQLVERGQRVVLVIATDGEPSSTYGHSSDMEKQRVVQILRRLGEELSVFMVIRLTTDDDETVQYYNEVDEQLELPLEVLDDIASEAKEIYNQGNGWLTYSPLIHRIREGGTFVKLFDLLDERQLSPTEVSVFAQLLLRGEGGAPMPRTAEDFLRSLSDALGGANEVYDPLRRRMRPPIDIFKAEWVVIPVSVRLSKAVRAAADVISGAFGGNIIGGLERLSGCMVNRDREEPRTDLVF